MGGLACDRCHKQQPDLEIFMAGHNLPNEAVEDRLREALNVDGHEVGGVPKLCGACQQELDHVLNP